MWTQSSDRLQTALTDNTLNWMTKPYRLADALLRVCDSLTVEVQFQGVASYVEGERELLSTKDNTCYAREVLLCADGATVCFARTVMPLTTYQACKNEFDTMSSKLLGKNFLYSKGEGVTRSHFYYAAIDAQHAYFQKSKVADQQTLGARTSVFCVDALYPLLVTEVFLPNIPVYKAQEAVEL